MGSCVDLLSRHPPRVAGAGLSHPFVCQMPGATTTIRALNFPTLQRSKRKLAIHSFDCNGFRKWPTCTGLGLATAAAAGLLTDGDGCQPLAIHSYILLCHPAYYSYFS